MTTTAVRKISNSNPSILTRQEDSEFSDLWPYSQLETAKKKTNGARGKWKPLVDIDAISDELARGETPFSIAFSMIHLGEDSADAWE